MRCPVCEDVTLSISSREGIEIDHCPQCRGVWLDRGELDKIIERAAPSVVGGRPSGPPVAGHDYGRLPQHPEPPTYPSTYGYEDYYRGRPPKKRKRSFLEDIFDFD